MDQQDATSPKSAPQTESLAADASPRIFDDAVLDHVDRCWRAECENAERLAKERHLVLTVLIAFLGLGLFKVEWLQAIVTKNTLPSPWDRIVVWAVMLGLAIAVGMFVRALWCLVHRPNVKTASAHLRLPSTFLAKQLPSEDEQRHATFSTTYAAYVSLMGSNERLRSRVAAAWRWFALGIAVVALVIVVYIGEKSAAVLLPPNATHGNATANTSAAHAQQ